MTQVSGLAPSQMEEMAAAPPMSKFTVCSSRGDERGQVGGDVETNSQDDDTDDQTTEAVLMNDRGDEHEHVGDAGEVGQRHNLVARENEGQEDGDRHEDERHGQGHG